MISQANKPTKQVKDATFDEFFKLIDDVVENAKTDSASKKLIESAVLEWQDDSCYAL